MRMDIVILDSINYLQYFVFDNLQYRGDPPSKLLESLKTKNAKECLKEAKKKGEINYTKSFASIFVRICDSRREKEVQRDLLDSCFNDQNCLDKTYFLNTKSNFDKNKKSKSMELLLPADWKSEEYLKRVIPILNEIKKLKNRYMI